MSSTSFTSNPIGSSPVDADTQLTDTQLTDSTTMTSDPVGAGTKVAGKLNLSKSTTVDTVDEKIEGSSPLKLTTDPNYLTNFCKNRNAPHKVKMKNPLDSLNKKFKPDILGICFGIVVVILLIWYFFKYYDAVVPFAGGIFNIIKFLIIYTIIIFVLKFFFKFVFTFKFWFAMFNKYLKLFLNPLLSRKVSSAYCYFTPYVNWLIYYPAKLFYLACLIGVCFIFFLIIIPIIVATSFVIGYLFSLLGDSRSVEQVIDNLKKAASSVKINTVKSSDLQSQAKEMVGQAPAMLSQAKEMASQAPGMLSSAASMLSKSPGLGAAASMLSKSPALGAALKGAPDILDSFKYKVLPAK